VTKGEQILPYLVMDLLGSYPGIPGLFVACVYSAALSTVSSGLNSLAAVCLKDFIQPFYKNHHMSERKNLNISKLLASFFGVITVGIAFLCQHMGPTVLQISLSIFGILGGPLLGVISLGMFCRFANSLGAFIGLTLSVIVNLWIGIGSVLYGIPLKVKPMNIEECDFLNRTNIFLDIGANATKTTADEPFFSSFSYLYRLSYLWYAGLAVAVVFFVGILVSLITGPIDSSQLNENLFFSIKRLSIYKYFISIRPSNKLKISRYDETCMEMDSLDNKKSNIQMIHLLANNSNNKTLSNDSTLLINQK
jgi:Na+/proline symporter